MLKVFLENRDVMKALINELNNSSFCGNSDGVYWPPPFLSIINSVVLSPKQILQWVDCVMEKVKPDECYIRDLETEKFMTPLALLIRCMSEVIDSFEGESAENKQEASDFPFELVRKLIVGGSDVNGYKISTTNFSMKKIKTGRVCPYQILRLKAAKKEQKTIHPLTYAKDSIYDWRSIEESTWKKILEYFVRSGVVLDINEDKPPFLTLTARALTLLTQHGVLKPETIPFKDIYLEMRNKVKIFHIEDGHIDLEIDVQEIMNIFDEFMVYTGSLILELGPGILASKRNVHMTQDLKEIMPEKFKNAPSLKVLCRHAVREAIALAKKDHSKLNMNYLIDCLPDDAIPRHLREDYLKMERLNSAVEKVFFNFLRPLNVNIAGIEYVMVG